MSAVQIVGTHRAFVGSDTPMEAWLRDDAGPLDLGGYSTIETLVWRGNDKPMILPASIDGDGSNGRVSWTVTAGDINRRLLNLGLFRLSIRADGQTLYNARLSVVG